MVYDIILCAALAAGFFYGYKRGLLRTIWGLTALVLSIILTIIIRPYFPETITIKGIPVPPAPFLFIAVRIVLAAAYRILSLIFTLPLLKQTNKLAGGIAQLIITAAALYVIFWAAQAIGTDIFNDTSLCRFMYDNNLLMSVIGL